MNTPIIVVGDAFTDVWMVGRSTRVSAEVAGLPIYDVNCVRQQPGGAANVSRAIRRLAPDAEVVDIFAPLGERPTKNRITIEGQQVCRFDVNDVCEPIRPQSLTPDLICDNIVVISDYGKGSIGDAQIKAIIEARPARIWVNAKTIQPYLERLGVEGLGSEGPPVCWTCNESEFLAAKDFYQAQTSVYMTRGAKGIAFMPWLDKKPGVCNALTGHKALSNNPVSVCGAGDVTLAALIITPKGYYPLVWAMSAAAESVERPFTYCPTYNETNDRYMEYMASQEELTIGK